MSTVSRAAREISWIADTVWATVGSRRSRISARAITYCTTIPTSVRRSHWAHSTWHSPTKPIRLLMPVPRCASLSYRRNEGLQSALLVGGAASGPVAV